ncbi:MAG: type II toxin-antitoxin system RelE/ParE family toxin [Burkholderiaceae bacterium]
MFQIKTFRRGDSQPFWDWLRALRDVQARARVRTRIDRLALGNMGQYRVLDGGVVELKIDWGPGYRVYFGKIGSTVVLLLCGGDKRTQQQDIKTAKAYLKEYQDAQEGY